MTAADLDRRIRHISHQQHRLARLRTDLEHAARQLRVGADEGVVAATLRAKGIRLGRLTPLPTHTEVTP